MVRNSDDPALSRDAKAANNRFGALVTAVAALAIER